MVQVEGVEIHPSAIDGRTEEYREFLDLWGRHCGAPRSVFQGRVNMLIQAELAAAGQDIVREIQAMQAQNRTVWRALARLLTDLDAYLGTVPDPAPVARALTDRVRRARSVLGLEGQQAD